MIETLDEAIKHCREKAEEKRKDYERAVALNIPSEGCLECALDHERLAAWLEELKERREEECPFNWGGDIDNKEVIRLIHEHMRIHSKKEPAVSVRLNKAFLIAIEKLKVDRWIPVSERLPDKSGRYLVTIREDVLTYKKEKIDVFDFDTNNGEEMIRSAVAWRPLPKFYENEGVDYTKEFPDLIVFKDTPKQELGENLSQHMPLKYKPLKFPEDGFMAKYGTRNSERLGE